MQAVRCRKCGQLLKVDPRVDQVRLKCPSCGSAVDVVIPHPLETVPYAGRPKWRMPRWPAVVVAVSIAAAMCGVVLLWYLANYPLVRITDQSGKVVFSGRMSDSQARRLRQRLATAEPPSVVDSSGGGADGADGAEGQQQLASVPSRPVAPPPDYMAATPGQAGQRATVVGVSPLSQAGIALAGLKVVAGRSGSARIVGWAQSNSGRDLKSITVVAELIDPQGRRIRTGLATRRATMWATMRATRRATRPATLRATLPATMRAIMPVTLRATMRAIPAGLAVPFSIEVDRRAVEQANRVEVRASAVAASAGEQCWLVDLDDGRLRLAGPTVTLTGWARCPPGGPVSRVAIYCDFFTVDGLYVGSVEGRLAGGGHDLTTAKPARFSASFDPAESGFVAEVVERWQARLIGTRP